MSSLNYLIAILPDRMEAEAAYTALEKDRVPLAQVSMLGRGYQSADEFGFLNPMDSAQKQVLFMLYWLVPVGFVLGVTFHQVTGYTVLPGVPSLANDLFVGCLSALLAGLGGFLVGGGVGLFVGGGDALVYRNRLDAGKYLIVVKGSEALMQRSTVILRQYQIENIQGYIAPPDAP